MRLQTEERLEKVEDKIQDSLRIQAALAQLSDACKGGKGPTSDCPILDAMEVDDTPVDAPF